MYHLVCISEKKLIAAAEQAIIVFNCHNSKLTEKEICPKMFVFRNPVCKTFAKWKKELRK
jgi:hypothetical protein